MKLDTYMNSLYGHAKVLRDYTGVRLPYVIPGEVEHGWTSRFLPGVDLTLEPDEKLHFVFNDRNLKQAVDHRFKAIAIGSPIIYMAPPAHTVTEGPRSLLLMPSHSIPENGFVNPVERAKAYLSFVQPALKEFSPVTCCLYWYDFQTPGVRTVFQEAGLKVATSAHREDPRFLYVLRDLVLRHRFVSTNELCTSLFYALYWGRNAFVLGDWTHVDDMRCFPYDKGMTTPIDTIEEQTRVFQSTMYPELRWANFDGKCHRNIGWFEVGGGFKRTPEELRALFGWTPRQFRLDVVAIAAQCLPEVIKRPLRSWAPAFVPLVFAAHLHSYIDPGSGSLVLQAVVGAIVAVAVGIKVFWGQITAFFAGLRKKGK